MTATIRHSYIRPETRHPSARDARDARRHRASSGASGSSARGGQPNYVARRTLAMFVAVVAIAVAALVAAAAIGVATETVANAGGQPAVASGVGGQAVDAPSVHLVQPGESLWSIADRYRGDVAKVRYVDALIDLNGSTVIQPGQGLRLP